MLKYLLLRLRITSNGLLLIYAVKIDVFVGTMNRKK